MTPITFATPSPPKGRSPSFPTTLHVRSNIRSTSISMPSAISWNVASQNSSSSAASQPASKRPPEITVPSSLSQRSSYGCDKCPHHLGLWTFAVGPHLIRPKPVGPNLCRGQLISPHDLIPRLDCWMIQNGSYRLLGAIFPNGEVHHGGLEGHSDSLHPNQPALLSQFFCHPANMSLRAGRSTGPA